MSIFEITNFVWDMVGFAFAILCLVFIIVLIGVIIIGAIAGIKEGIIEETTQQKP